MQKRHHLGKVQEVVRELVLGPQLLHHQQVPGMAKHGSPVLVVAGQRSASEEKQGKERFVLGGVSAPQRPLVTQIEM